ncbi:hypothetical protein ALQ94_101817 [Pseudomonas amygdali pv. morsprunorum]|uniref:Uncharacterized protein n=1 Tax=Pseudomonas amygdali pv. morsprunorum TaxID=129138 RepID=A0A3M2WFM7_PSEA0|nr:hypothetical protein PSYMP_08885 [Pseudomonas amygdali pv. morsprunorum str. M302280]RML50357.1 hypothetical protein ALQ94_101817 [Pseudomonas amygdali pv. morsprunorum]
MNIALASTFLEKFFMTQHEKIYYMIGIIKGYS